MTYRATRIAVNSIWLSERDSLVCMTASEQFVSNPAVLTLIVLYPWYPCELFKLSGCGEVIKTHLLAPYTKWASLFREDERTQSL
jgi:hypothetical protein